MALVDEWEFAYLPADKEEREGLPIPPLPLVLDFPHITRRVAAQRSRFVANSPARAIAKQQ